MQYLRHWLCCKSHNPTWLSHLMTSEWCRIFVNNQRFINGYNEDAVKVIHEKYQMRQSPEQLLDDIARDINSKNCLETTIGLFSSFIRMNYIDTIHPTQITINRIRKDYEQFVEVFKECLIIYYRLEKIEQLFESETFIRKSFKNFVIRLIFGNDDFSQTVNRVQRAVDKETNDKIQFNMQKFQLLKPEDYGISAHYSLNQATLKLFNRNDNIPESDQVPYSKSVELIRQIVKERSPECKLRKVQAVVKSIEQSISQFYSKYKLPKYEPLNADSLISILVFILVQSKQSSLTSHLKIVTNYVNKQELSSNLGYSLASIEACLQFIEKGNIKRTRSLTVNESDLSLWLNLQNYFQQITNVHL